MNWILIVGVVAVLAIIAFATHLLLAWFEKRGWVYYRSTDAPRPRSLGLLEEIYQPSTTHVVDQETLEDSLKDQTETGDPDRPGTYNPDQS